MQEVKHLCDGGPRLGLQRSWCLLWIWHSQDCPHQVSQNSQFLAFLKPSLSRSKKIGILSRLVQILIISYVIGFVMIYKKVLNVNEIALIAKLCTFRVTRKQTMWFLLSLLRSSIPTIEWNYLKAFLIVCGFLLLDFQFMLLGLREAIRLKASIFWTLPKSGLEPPHPSIWTSMRQLLYRTILDNREVTFV